MDKKVSQLPRLETPTGQVLVYVIDNVETTPESKAIDLDSLFGNIVSNTIIDANFKVEGSTVLEDVSARDVVANTLVSKTPFTPSTSNTTSFRTGTFFWDTNYLYVKVNSNTFKRIPLQSF